MTTFTLETDRSLVRSSARSTRYVLATINAPVVTQAAERAPLDVAFVIDRSGSMGGEKIELAREAVLEGIGMLRDTDRFAVVSFDDHIEVVVPLTPATREKQRAAEPLVQGIMPRGSTNLGGGWLTGCRKLVETPRPSALTRCLLLSDGLANVGVTDHGELERLAADWRRQGIITTTLGVGADFDERLMTAMAQAGGGQGYFIRENRQVGDLLTNIIGEALQVVASDATITVDPAAGMDVDVLGRFELQRGPAGVRVALGSLVSGQELQIALKVSCPTGTEGESIALTARVDDRDGPLGTELVRIGWTFASHAANDAQPRNRTVDIAVARLYAAQARHDGVQLNREGRFDRARALLERVARRIEGYTGDCRELQELVRQLRRDMHEVSDQMSAVAQKQYHYASLAAMQSRSAQGKARRMRFQGELFPLELADGIPVFTCDRRRVVFDTGSSVSFGRGPLTIMGHPHDIPRQFGAIAIGQVAQADGGRIDALAGGDILAEYQWLLDAAGGRLLAAQSEFPCDGITLRTPTVAGIPTADVVIAGRKGRVVLDTGSKLTLVDASLVHGRPRVGHEHDFHPAFGAFETDVWDLPFEIAGQQVQARCGLLPPELQPSLALAGAHWLAGMDVLGQFPVVLDLAHGRMKIVVGDLEGILAGV